MVSHINKRAYITNNDTYICIYLYFTMTTYWVQHTLHFKYLSYTSSILLYPMP